MEMSSKVYPISLSIYIYIYIYISFFLFFSFFFLSFFCISISIYAQTYTHSHKTYSIQKQKKWLYLYFLVNVFETNNILKCHCFKSLITSRSLSLSLPSVTYLSTHTFTHTHRGVAGWCSHCFIDAWLEGIRLHYHQLALFSLIIHQRDQAENHGGGHLRRGNSLRRAY